MAGLLTCSPFSDLPIYLLNSDLKNRKKLIELTAAGQFWIYTKFPFNPTLYTKQEPLMMQMYDFYTLFKK